MVTKISILPFFIGLITVGLMLSQESLVFAEPPPPDNLSSTNIIAPDASTALACKDSQPPLITNFNIYQTPKMSEPLARVPFRDPVFRTCLVRATNRKTDLATGDTSDGLKNEYSRVQSFNADGTRLLVRGIDGTWYVYDAASFKPIQKVPIDIDPRWSASNPNFIYYSSDTRLMSYNLGTNKTSTVHNFLTDAPGAIMVWTRYEGSPSADGRYWGLMAEDKNWLASYYLIYDLGTNKVIAKRDLRTWPVDTREADSVTISPLGNYFLVQMDKYCKPGTLGTDKNPCGLMVYDKTLQNGRGLLRIVGHSDTAIDAQGREVFIFQDVDTDHISMLDLKNGSVTTLLPLDYSHSDLGLHFSGRAYKRPGWALVSTYNGAIPSATWMDDQIFVVELKAKGRVVRLAHTHSIMDEGQEQDYWAEPQASTNPDFTRIVFTTNWGRSGTTQTEMMTILLPKNWLDTVGQNYPIVLYSKRANSNPTNQAIVNFTVKFSQNVTGVGVADFGLTTSKISGASLKGVTGTGTTRVVSVNTGTGSGTLRLNVIDNDSIQNGAHIPLGGTGAGNGNFNFGETYTISKLPPATPHTYLPSGVINDTHPVYKWSAPPLATSYTLQVYNVSTGSYGINKTVLPSCSGSPKVCTYHPTTPVLAPFNYKFRVIAKNAYGNSPPSTWRLFTYAGVGFNSQFNGNAIGWQRYFGVWSNTGTTYFSNGLSNACSSSSYEAIFSNFDLSAKIARMEPDNEIDNPFGLIIRGKPGQYTTSHQWKNAYYFTIDDHGNFIIYKMVGGVKTYLQPSTPSGALNRGNAYNLLRVRAVGNSFKFYINNHLVWSGLDNSFNSGRIGLHLWQGGSGHLLRADYATLTVVSATTGETDAEIIDPVQQALNENAWRDQMEEMAPGFDAP